MKEVKRHGKTLSGKKKQSEKCIGCMISTIRHLRKGKTIEIVKI